MLEKAEIDYIDRILYVGCSDKQALSRDALLYLETAKYLLTRIKEDIRQKEAKERAKLDLSYLHS